MLRRPIYAGGVLWPRTRTLARTPPRPTLSSRFVLPLSIRLSLLASLIPTHFRPRPLSHRPSLLSLTSPLTTTPQEPGMNSDAQPLTVAEREEIMADPACMARFVTSYEMQVGNIHSHSHTYYCSTRRDTLPTLVNLHISVTVTGHRHTA